MVDHYSCSRMQRLLRENVYGQLIVCLSRSARFLDFTRSDETLRNYEISEALAYLNSLF
jgi:hypothetical protein